MNYFVTGIDTNSGKTLASAILCTALQADYWKPIQTGSDDRDLDTIEGLINNNHVMLYNEAYLLKEPASPHQAAAKEGVTIDIDRIFLPQTSNNLIIEGAGGVLVPLNDKDFVIDLAAKFEAEVILVANIYLGSINHTILTVNELKRRRLPIKGIIFNGPENHYTVDYIIKHTGLKKLLHMKTEEKINQEIITRYAIELFQSWE